MINGCAESIEPMSVVAMWTDTSPPPLHTAHGDATIVVHSYRLCTHPPLPITLGQPIRLYALTKTAFHSPSAVPAWHQAYDPHIIEPVVSIEPSTPYTVTVDVQIVNQCARQRVTAVNLEAPNAPGVLRTPLPTDDAASTMSARPAMDLPDLRSVYFPCTPPVCCGQLCAKTLAEVVDEELGELEEGWDSEDEQAAAQLSRAPIQCRDMQPREVPSRRISESDAAPPAHQNKNMPHTKQSLKDRPSSHSVGPYRLPTGDNKQPLPDARWRKRRRYRSTLESFGFKLSRVKGKPGSICFESTHVHSSYQNTRAVRPSRPNLLTVMYSSRHATVSTIITMQLHALCQNTHPTNRTNQCGSEMAAPGFSKKRVQATIDNDDHGHTTQDHVNLLSQISVARYNGAWPP